MSLIFFIKSKTININNYTIKDIPGSSGRLDVISRCILSAILRNNDFERNIQIWVFLDRYGTFIFNPEFFNYEIFPKNELRFTDYFVKFLQKYHNRKPRRRIFILKGIIRIKASNAKHWKSIVFSFLSYSIIEITLISIIINFLL